MPWSIFTAYMRSNRKHMGETFYQSLRTEGVHRLQRRFAETRASSPLCFADLIAQAETRIAPK